MRLKSSIALLYIISAIICGHAQNLKIVNESIKPTSSTEGVLPIWPTKDADGNRNPKQALIIVKYDGFPEEEILKTEIKPDISNFNGSEKYTDANGQPITFLYIPLDNTQLRISSSFGPAGVNLPKMKDKGIYEMILLVDKRMNINIEPLTDFESVKVYLDRSVGKDTPANFDKVTLGKHSLRFELADGRTETREIDVTVTTEHFNEVTNPDLDLRQRIPVKVESSNKDVTVYINDVAMSNVAPFTTQLPSGEHTFKVVSNKNDREFDVTTRSLEKGSSLVAIKLQPRERHKFEVTATFQESRVPFMLYIDKEEAYKISVDHAKGDRPNFVFDLPLGSKYKFRATYQGNEAKRTIKVKPDMDYNQIIRIKKNRKFVWPWEREYMAPPVGLTIVYTQKQYHVKHNGQTEYKGTMTLWDEEEGGNSKWLHGIKAGVQYQPTFGFGLGLYTGLFYEYYRSITDKFDIDKEEGLTSNFSKYQEHSVTMPVEIFYNFPFASKVALAFHGGIEGNYMLARTYSGFVEKYDGIKYEDSYNALKDEDNFFPELPKAFNLYWQVGAQLRLGPIMLGAQMTRPITKHKWYANGLEFTTTCIKNSLSLTYVF